LAKKPGFLSRLKSVFKRHKDTAVEISDEVIASIEKQLEQTPNNFRLRLKLADSYLTLGEREKALEVYCKTARLYIDQDFTPLAIATYKKILNEEPEHLEANLELGHLYLQKKFFADATTYLHSAFNYCRSNSLDNKSLQILETIIEIAPDKEQYKLLLKKLFPDHKENIKSIYSDLLITKKDAHDDIRTVPDESSTIDNFFDLSAELGSGITDVGGISDLDIDETVTTEEDEFSGVEEIFQTLRSAYEENEGDSDPDKFHYNLALAYNELNMPEQALQESDKALKSNNFRLPSLLLRSHIFFAQGALSTALSQVQQGLLEKGLTIQDFLTFKLQLGLILKEMGHQPQALDAFREAYSLDPDNQELADEISALESSVQL
jgi:tetratricopeptide (TPR) repeat protein